MYRAIFERRDVRRYFLSKPIPVAVLARLLRVGGDCVGGGCVQPLYVFMVVVLLGGGRVWVFVVWVVGLFVCWSVCLYVGWLGCSMFWLVVV